MPLMKPHYHILDGLRGTAALSVFAFHFLEMLVPSLNRNPMPHGFLAVEFFFALSGFVLGHACGGRAPAPSGFVAWRLGRRMHIFLCAASALALLWTARKFGSLGYAWGWDHFWVAPVRLACPFLLGLLIYRMRLRMSVPAPFTVLSLLLLAVFCAPAFGAANWMFEAACVILVFPLVLMAGAGSKQPAGTIDAVTRLVGELSYPVLIVHYPFIYLFAHWNWTTHPSRPVLAAAIVGLYCGVALFALGLSRWYDRPVRTCVQVPLL